MSKGEEFAQPLPTTLPPYTQDGRGIVACKINKQIWVNGGLFIFFLPKYSPHLNITEILWQIMKGKWLVPEDYLDKEILFYALNRCMANVGKELEIKFNPFKPK